MRTTNTVITGCLLVLGSALSACRSDMSSPDVVAADVVADAGNRPDALPDTNVVDTGTTDAPADVNLTGAFTITQLQNPAAAGHPMPSSTSSAPQITVGGGGTMVALTTRFVSGPSAAGNCTYITYVGLTAGGPYSGIQVVESEPAPTTSGQPACGQNDPALIPGNLAIGDVVNAIIGQFEDYCPSTSVCPAGTASQMYLKMAHGSMFNVTSPGTGGTTLPTPTVVAIADVMGSTTNAPMSLALQNTLVTIHGVFQQQIPVAGAGGNHGVMTVSASATDTTNVMTVSVESFTHASCTRTGLATIGLHGSVGNVTGVLNYSFGAWTIQVTQASDLPMVDSTCAADGGVTDGSVTDAGVTDAGSVDATTTGG